MNGLDVVVGTILRTMDFRNPKLREEGMRAANEMISIIEGSVDDDECHEMFSYGCAYVALARFAEAEDTKDGYNMALHYYEKVRDHWKSKGNEVRANEMEAAIEQVKAKRGGDGLFGEIA